MRGPETRLAYRRPESVLVVVYTRDGQALVLERADRPGLWQSVTGSLENGEAPQAAAARELHEETGLTERPLATGVVRRFEILPHWQPRYAPGVTHNDEHEFRLELARRPSMRLDAAEHCRFQWLPIDAAARKVFSWTNRAALEALAAP